MTVNRPNGDDILFDLAEIDEILVDARYRLLSRSVRTAADMIRAARAPVTTGLTDAELARKLAAAAQACDSVLLDEAAARLGRRGSL